MRGFKNFNEAENFIEKNNIEIIDFKIIDLSGRWHHLTIPKERFNETIFTDGIGFDGSSYGFLTVEKSDMVFIPDLTTAFVDPFNVHPTLVMIADIYRLEDGKRIRFEDDPRYVAQKAEQYLKDQGICDRALFGPEFEFYVLSHISYEMNNRHMAVTVDSNQANWNNGKNDTQNLGINVQSHGGYHVDAPFDSSFDFRNDTVRLLEENGVPVKYHHSENGAPGQVEIEVNFATLTEMADRTMKLKYILKNNAVANGLTTTFMPKPFPDECGSGMHVHLHFFNGDTPLFYDEKGYAGLSELAENTIGGVLSHAKAMMPITNPSTNSYKRMVPGFEAPLNICYGNSNRSAVIRIPGYATKPEEKRWELRSPDATCNPYFAYAAIAMAAADGAKKKIKPQEMGFGPYDKNLYALSNDELKDIPSLPTSVLESCDELEKDYEFLLEGGVFTKQCLQNIMDKQRKEHYYMSSLPHPEEFKLYF